MRKILLLAVAIIVLPFFASCVNDVMYELDEKSSENTGSDSTKLATDTVDQHGLVVHIDTTMYDGPVFHY